jgi:pimeloyl-ACP methyl ester carboxylesterase
LRLIFTHAFGVHGVRQVFHVAGDGPVCVALPGGPGVEYAYLRSPELEEHFTMVYVEPVGTGASGRLADYRMDTYVRFLDAVISHLGAPVRLLGHAYGGFVALRYTLEHPDRVAGLALYDTSPTTGPDFVDAALAQLDAYPHRYPDIPAAAGVPSAVRLALAATDDETLTEDLRAGLPVFFAEYWSRRGEFEPLTHSVRAYAAPAMARDPVRYDVRDRLGEIGVPTAVLAGRHDFVCGPRWGWMLHAGIRDSQLTIFENSGHLAHLEQPAEFVKAVAGPLLP